jgi:hypothetical protein
MFGALVGMMPRVPIFVMFFLNSRAQFFAPNLSHPRNYAVHITTYYCTVENFEPCKRSLSSFDKNLLQASKKKMAVEMVK